VRRRKHDLVCSLASVIAPASHSHCDLAGPQMPVPLTQSRPFRRVDVEAKIGSIGPGRSADSDEDRAPLAIASNELTSLRTARPALVGQHNHIEAFDDGGHGLGPVLGVGGKHELHDASKRNVEVQTRSQPE